MKDFYIDFSEYSEAVASVLYEEVQKHAFELGCIWQNTGVRIEKYQSFWVSMIFRHSVMSKWCVSCPELDKVSVEEFLKMEKEPEYRVGMPMGQDACNDVSVYIGRGGCYDVFKAIPIKHSSKRLEYTLCDHHMYDFWKPIDPSRIKVTIK